jgi:glycosyltransferase involved in cell wall biosynthesis
MRPPVSVIVPTYNRASTIGRALNSILVQTEDRDEVIVVDDGSVDSTEQVVSCFGPQVRYIRQPNKGPGAARNRGVAESGNDLIAFLDSDDEWIAGKLDMQCALLEARPDVVMCFADMRLILEDGRRLDSAIGRWQSGARPWETEMRGPLMLSEISKWAGNSHDVSVYIGDLYSDMLIRCWIHCNTSVFRRSLLGDELRFPEQLSIYEDWECFARAARVGPLAFLDCSVATQISHSLGRLTECDMLTRAASRVALLERVWGGDQEFLRVSGPTYRRVLHEQRTVKFEQLILAGRSAEARAELSRIEGFSARRYLLASLPGWILITLPSVRRIRSNVRKRIVSLLPPAVVGSLKQMRSGLRRLREKQDV